MPEHRPRILIVDDREQNRYVLRRVLERAGYACEEASTGPAALERAQTLPALVILDVNLPGISGTQVCQKIKQDPLTAHVSVLQISAAFVSAEDKARALDAGADGYLTHPIDGVVLLATVRSLLRLKKAETLALDAAATWQGTFDSLQEGLAVVDADGNLAQANRAFQEMCRGSGAWEWEEEPAAGLLRRVFGTDEPLLKARDGRHVGEYSAGERTVRIAVDALSTPHGQAGFIVVISDITDRKLADYAVRTAEKLAESGRLAQSLAHEINNPLEAITNLLYLAEESNTEDEVKQYLSLAGEQLSRISRITKQSLSFHRDTLQPIGVNVGEIVGEVVDMYGKLAARRNIEIVFDPKSALSIRGFPGQLRQVFGNLVRNALDAASPNTSVNVRVRSSRRSRGLGTRVTIHDRGTGIPWGIREKLFDPFFTTKELKGSGLGLWVSRAIISNHHGTLRFRSTTRVGASGTTFEVFLPVDLTGPTAASGGSHGMTPPTPINSHESHNVRPQTPRNRDKAASSAADDTPSQRRDPIAMKRCAPG